LRVCAARSALVGRFTQARSESAAAGVLALRLNDPVACAVTDQFTGLLALARGDWNEVPNGLGPTAELFPQIPMFQAAHALQSHLMGQQAQAQAGYEHLRLLLARPLRGIRGLGLLQYLTELVEVFDDAEAADWALAHWLPWVATGGLPGNAEYFCAGGPARAVGRMAAIKGDLEEAEAALRVAASINTQLNAQPWLTHTWLALAQVLGRRGGTARLTEAATLAGRAAAQARRLDQPGPRGAADTLLAALTAQRRVDDPLTTREHEIAGLLAAAMSNRQIADRLVLSERTVESHVHNILRKLRVANRTQLTAHLLGGQH
jgi:DNA-binding CsgD family transcriptional regulator